MTRRSAGTVVAALLAACAGDPSPKPETPPPPSSVAAASAVVTDTTPPKLVDLSKLKSNLPPSAPDTFTPRPERLKVVRIPDAPPDLMDAAEREEGISRFCYQEYGQKVDPKLIGAVALVVTVAGDVVTAAKVGADDWSSRAGRGVNTCLVQKAPQAWKLLPGVHVADGQYVVQLRFRPS